MKDNRILSRAFRGAALLIVAIGLFLTLKSLLSFSERRGRIERRLADLQEIEAMGSSMESARSAIKTYQALPQKTLPDLERIAEGLEIEAQINTGNSESLFDGWRLRRSSVVISETTPEKLVGFVLSATGGRPPWQVVRCECRALPGSVGRVRATLAFEGIEK